MPSRIRIGPDGGPYVIVEENNGDLDITTPDNTIDLQNSGLINAALSGVLDAQTNDISNVGTLTADSVSTGVLNTDWVIDAGDYASIQAAIDATQGSDNRICVVPPGDYTEQITVKRGVILMGVSPSRIENGTVITSNAADGAATITTKVESQVIGLSAVQDNANAYSLELDERSWATRNYLTGDVLISQSDNHLYGNSLLGADITINGGSNVVIGNTRTGTISDNGTGNQVSNNA